MVSERWNSAPGSFPLAPCEAVKSINELFQDFVGFYCSHTPRDVYILHKLKTLLRRNRKHGFFRGRLRLMLFSGIS